MANRRSAKLHRDNVQEKKLCAEQRWVQNVLLMDIRKVGLFPSNCGDERVSNETSRECENISENLATVTDGQNFSETIEEYVNVASLGKCFVDGCSFKTKSLVSLFYHVLCSHKEVNKYNCTFCSHACPLSGMVEHLTMHGPSMFQCKYCSHHHFSQLKVREHIKLKHVGCPLVVVELRDFKEEEGCDTSEDEDEEVEIVECMDVEPVVLKQECSEWKDETEALENGNFCGDKRDNCSKNFNDNSCGDMSIWGSKTKRLKPNECNESLNELDSAINESKSVKENGCDDLRSSKGEMKHSEGRSANASGSKTKLASKSLQLFYGPEEIQMKINLKSTAHNYHSSELNLRKDALEKNWQCGMCDFVGLYNNMIAHAESAHDVKYQFKCSRCSIFIASRGYVESHCMIFHPNSLVTLIANYFLPGSSLPFKEVKVTLPDGQEIFTPDKPVFSNKIPEVYL